MSSLGLSLLILIVVAIGALAAYNFWLTRKPGHRSADMDTGFSSDTAKRQEPSFSAGASEPYLQSDPYPEPDPVPESLAEAPSGGQSPNRPAYKPSDPFTQSPLEAGNVGRTDESDATPTHDNSSKWVAGVLPEAPPAPAPPDLRWQAEAATDSSSFEGSIQQAMRLQREADDLIGPATSVGDQAADAPESSDSDDQIDATAALPLQDAEALEPTPLAEVPPLIDEDSRPDPKLPEDEPAAQSQFVEPDAGSALVAESAPEPAPAPQSGLSAPGWSGMDADRKASNFVATVNIELSAPTKGAELIALTGKLTHAGTKPVRVTAGNPPAGAQKLIRTEPINADRDYALLRLEVLQVNRHGPLDGVEYSSFVAAADRIGESLGVLVNPPDMNVVLIRSRVLDAEVASLDAQVAVNVETEDPISNERFVELAKENGLTEPGNKPDSGVWVAMDDGGHVIYSAQLNTEANRVVLVLDVPAVPRELQPVRKMVEGAWAFAQALHGQMIDDNGRAIDNALFERIESQIETHYQALLDAGVPAGSDLARQVYNQL